MNSIEFCFDSFSVERYSYFVILNPDFLIMYNWIKKTVFAASFLIASGLSASQAQILRDSSTLKLVSRDIDLIYNMQFNEAREVYRKIAAVYPNHPVVFLLHGMISYWENFPLLDNSPAKESFENDLKECIRLSEKPAAHENEAELILSDLCGRGFLLLFYSGNNLVMEVIPVASGMYKYLMRSFNFTSACADLYYYTGVYNYYRDAYPKIYPVYKPLALLFPQGNMQTGLQHLQIAATNSIVMKAEAEILLAYIYIYFENDFNKALEYSMLLHRQFPDNTEFTSILLRNLLLLKRYDAAEKIIKSVSEGSANLFIQAQLDIYTGIIREKRDFDYKTARELYNKGIRNISGFGAFGEQYASYGYFGLSRISASEGEKHASQMFRKEALRLADFKKIDFN
jgi:hypothetical protein